MKQGINSILSQRCIEVCVKIKLTTYTVSCIAAGRRDIKIALAARKDIVI